jgi:hypothetical protein
MHTQYLNISICVQRAIEKQFQNFLPEETEKIMASFDAPFGLPHFIQTYKETDTFERKYGLRVYLVPVSKKMKGKIGKVTVKVTLEHTTKVQGGVAV